ncbi:MAG TPA: hypothetical protein VGF94_19615 [Kofleriaceae bacterium]|jgi:hypothetical protein
MVARLAVSIVLLCAGCRGMGGLGRGLGHLAGGLGKATGALAKGVGHAAPAVARGLGRELGTSVKVAGHVAVHVAEPVIETTIEAAAAQQVLAPDDPCFACPLDVDCQDCVGYGGRACMPGFDPAGVATCVTADPVN